MLHVTFQPADGLACYTDRLSNYVVKFLTKTGVTLVTGVGEHTRMGQVTMVRVGHLRSYSEMYHYI